jgi:Restriction endonuclease BglII
MWCAVAGADGEVTLTPHEDDNPAELEPLVARGFQVKYLNHARAILNVDFPEALAEIQEVLSGFSITLESLIRGGGGEHDLTQRLRGAFASRGWTKHIFEIEKLIDGRRRESQSHEVDHVRQLEEGDIALEIEWNNKDPFYDRDLENFKRLHAEGAISVGVIVTRGKELHESLPRRILRFAEAKGFTTFDDLLPYDVVPTRRQRGLVEKGVKAGLPFPAAWMRVFVGDKFGESTTHWDKLDVRVHRGVGNPCPLLLIGIPEEVLID